MDDLSIIINPDLTDRGNQISLILVILLRQNLTGWDLQALSRFSFVLILFKSRLKGLEGC